MNISILESWKTFQKADCENIGEIFINKNVYIVHSCYEYHIPEPNNIHEFVNYQRVQVITFYILYSASFYVLGTCINSRVDEICIGLITNTEFF